MLQNSTNPKTNALYLCFKSVIRGEVAVTSVPRGSHIRAGSCPSAIPAGVTWLMVHTWSPFHPLPVVGSVCCQHLGFVGLFGCFCCCFCLVLAKLRCLGTGTLNPVGRARSKSHFMYLRLATVNFSARNDVCPVGLDQAEETVIDLEILGAMGCRRRDEEIRATPQSQAESTRLTKGENKGKIKFSEQGL